jgi:hypothetical protein
MKGSQYFRSEDPVEAAQFVVSDAAALLWETVRDRHGFSAFARQSAPQLLRWESRYGWTTHGWGQVSEKETSLASVLVRMLAAPDAWTTFADCYLAALDQVARADATAPPRIYYGSWGPGDNGYRQRERARNLAEWHGLLLERLAGSGAEDRLGRLASHRALGGPDRTFLQAHLAHQRGDIAAARKLIADCLRELPGDQDFARFAAKIGAG